MILLGAIINPSYSSAQDSTTVKAKTKSPLIERLSVRTNAFEWLLTVPNVQAGFDLFPGPYNRSELLAGVKWKPDTYHQQPPFYVFNLLDLRGEYRWHFRFKQQKPGEKFNFFSLYRRNPRPWIAHYLGGYMNYGTYSVKPSKKGADGWQTGLGVSYGIELPLYEYGNSAVDLDLGASAGLAFFRYDLYSLNYANTGYARLSDTPDNLFIPVVSELRATFILRKTSVRTRYTKVDPEIKIMADKLTDIRMGFEGTNKQTFDDSRDRKTSALYAQNDSLYRADYVKWVQETVDEQLESINSEYTKLNEKRKEKLSKEVRKLGKEAIADFDRQVREKKQAALNAQREEERQRLAKEAEEKKAAKEAEKAAKEAAKNNQKAEEVE